MSAQETSGIVSHRSSNFQQFHTDPETTACQLMQVIALIFSFSLLFIGITRRTPGITFLARRVCLCLTAKKNACARKHKQSFTEQAVYTNMLFLNVICLLVLKMLFSGYDFLLAQDSSRFFIQPVQKHLKPRKLARVAAV